MRRALAALALTACAGPARAPEPPLTAPPSTDPVAAPADATPRADAPPPPLADERWLRGSTHENAQPSGDSKTPVPDLIAWYATRGYDFIALTDHNRVTEIDGATDGQVAAHVGDDLIVLAGVELTNNPDNCAPAPAEDGKCRIHVNLLGVTARPLDRLAWAAHQAPARVDKYQAALDQRAALGGLAQLNHPQWYWGMSGALLTELGRRGMTLVEVANTQFPTWNAGTDVYPSMDELWDAALTAGVTMWGVASDDAHHYDGGGRYPAGGGWVVVRARRDPDAILAALAGGRFYASTGVELIQAGVDDGALVVEVAPGTAAHRITFIGDGRVLGELAGPLARWPLDGAASYVRAVVSRDDGARAWVQPARPAR